MDLTLQLAATQGLIPAVRTASSKSSLAHSRTVMTMSLADDEVGAILGKRGQTLTQIQQVSRGSGVGGAGQGSVRVARLCHLQRTNTASTPTPPINTIPPIINTPPQLQNAKVAIKISERSRMSATQEREVTVSGSYSGIQLACALMNDKLAANRPRHSSGGFSGGVEGEEEAFGGNEEGSFSSASGVYYMYGGV